MPALRSLWTPRRTWWSLGFALLLISAPAVAQIPGLPPGTNLSAQDIETLLATRPDLVAQLRQRISDSGLTPDQVRQRLKAAGYPEDLLDPYLSSADTTQTATPTGSQIGAFSALGLLSAGADSLLGLDSSATAARAQLKAPGPKADSLRADSLADTTGVKGGLKRFGIDVFRRASTQFQALQVGPVDRSYRLGPGDVLVLILTGDVEITRTLEVNREGFVFIPQVGEIFVGNLTLDQLEGQLYTRLGRVYSGVRRGPNARTHFSVTVARLRNVQVYVVGDVLRPGAYQISAGATVLGGLYLAGGPTDNGSFRRIELRRGGAMVDSVDVYDYLLKGASGSGTHLEPGDVIFVPVRGPLVAVTGRVVRPAIYEVRPNETLRDVIAAAGGLDANAVEGRIQIHRILQRAPAEGGGPQRVVIDVTAPGLAVGEVPAFPLAPGDSVMAFEVPPHVRGYVTVRGNVLLPGRIGFNEGMKLSDAIRLAGGPKPDVYLERVLVARLRPDSSRLQLRAALADSTGRVVDDITLQDGDDIRIFSRATFRTQPWVTIVGAVRRSGRVLYRDGLTLRDAILLADGLTEDAALDSAEIARLPDNRPTGALAQTIRIALDSTYLPSRSPAVTPAGTGEIQLLPYDNVLIQRRPGWDLQRLVAVTGQVERPGRYALTSKTERLTDLLARAGGLTTEAYPGGIEFYRRAATAKVTPAPIDPKVPIQPLPPGFAARVGIDLPMVLQNPAFRDNIILATGDSVFVPEFNPLVQVQGAVNAAGPVAYTPGKNLDWYVAGAGGYAEKGDRGRAFVTQPDGKREAVKRRFFFSDDIPTPGPGAVITVPERRGGASPNNTAAILGVLASVFASLTTVIVVLKP
ncbi:MAG TPA: SLBB domain-containing protein, partial [Gemmatimonadales bacterium]|nr:SLBB domain-containing protein [Gemmatimonadales bacterium]